MLALGRSGSCLEARQVVGAVAVAADSAHLLGVDAQSPVMLVRRFYLGRNDRLLSVSVNVYPMGRFEFVTRRRLEDASKAAGQVRIDG
jgi:GntR family transcriptional regulator